MFQQDRLISLPESDYHAHHAISKSGLDRIAISPAHYRAWKEAPPEPTDAMLFGTACHRLILEPELFESSCVVEPESLSEGIMTKAGKPSTSPKSTDEYKDRYAKWSSEQLKQGKLILKADQYETLRGMAEAWRAHPRFKEVHREANHEPSAFWLDPETGLECKARPDIVHPNGLILDLKTTDSALPSDFQRTIAKFRYHVQAAWYLDGVSRASGFTFDQFIFIVIEKKPPFGISLFVASPQMIEQGRAAYQKDFAVYASCMRTESWPSYPTEVQPIDLPAWAFV